ncbi:MAG: family 20 glycosylhydrolase [Bacteroidales bacterium]|nr:family 20 glycosylhydrolase [Bacteroidales bacterium]
MKKAIKIIGWVLLLIIAGLAIAWFGFLKPKPPPISPEDRAQITIMPLPSEMKLNKSVFVLNEDLNHAFTALSTPRLERAVERFYGRLSSQTGLAYGDGMDATLILECNGSEMEYPSHGDDESYSIRISGNRIAVEAGTETGIIYGLESLLQLVRKQEDQWILPGLTLNDNPRYGWRGLMIDACRHWIPKDVILRNLDAMATVKMNVLHWHLTEYQGFRVESKVFPKLHEMGSEGDYYTQDDIRKVVEYAADRGIRVIPEFDLPGHTTSWFVGYPDLASAPGPYSLDTTFGVLDPVLDPTREEVYEFLDRFFGEMAGLFPDDYIHIGGDEVKPLHWNENPAIQEFMKENDLDDPHALQAYFNIRLQKLLKKHDRKMMGWDEIIHSDLPKQGIAVQTWRDQTSLWESARKGNKAILSAGYYLDYKQPAAFHYNVDPTVIPGAVSIEIDSTNWKGWDCTMDLSDMVIDGSVYLFGEGAGLRGIMKFMGGSAGFTDVVSDGDHILFSVETNFGQVKYDIKISGDSIVGSGKLSFITMQLKGKRSGGTDMEGGEPLPEFTRIDPLTPEQESNILGGEACMWSEMVDQVTLESRVWPRAAAVGEKLWSPKVLTDDSQDMYRRIMVMDDLLESLGVRHRDYSEGLLGEMVGEPYLHPLHSLVELLQEDKFFNRMIIYDPEPYTTTPLNRIVDAARPESYVAYRFGQDVDLWIDEADQAARSRMMQSLETWSVNHEKLAPAFERSERIREVEAHSKNLSSLAEIGLEALSEPGSLKGRAPELEVLFNNAAGAHGGTILPLVGPVKKLVENSAEN